MVWSIGHQAKVEVDGKEVLLDIPGKWRLESQQNRPLIPGDKVVIVEEASGWRISELLTRRNSIARYAPGANRTPKTYPQVLGVNMDYVVVIASIAEPVTPTGFVDRVLVSAELQDVETILVLNKVDLVTAKDRNPWQEIYKGIVKELFFVSGMTGSGIGELNTVLESKSAIFLGSSGVGKSTLLNKIDPDCNIKTQQISLATGKGMHTTSYSQLYHLSNGADIVDTPGMREFLPWGIEPSNLTIAFPEMRELADECKYRDCLHRDELDCAILRARQSNIIKPTRYASYLKLLEQAIALSQPVYNNNKRR